MWESTPGGGAGPPPPPPPNKQRLNQHLHWYLHLLEWGLSDAMLNPWDVKCHYMDLEYNQISILKKLQIFLQKFAQILFLLSLLDWVLHYGFDIISGFSVKVIILTIFLLEMNFSSFFCCRCDNSWVVINHTTVSLLWT
jgi:hypothetical protein